MGERWVRVMGYLTGVHGRVPQNPCLGAASNVNRQMAVIHHRGN